MQIITLFLTCANDQEGNKISQALLKKKLVVCIKKTKVASSFLWQGRIDKSEEVLLIMDSVEEKFEDIEREVRKLHSYETFVLVANPVIRSSAGIKEWIENGLKLL